MSNQEIERGTQARQLIEHPLWDESWQTFEAEVLKAWGESPARDTEGREALFLLLKAGQRARRHIETVFETGKLALMQRESDERKPRSKTD